MSGVKIPNIRRSHQNIKIGYNYKDNNDLIANSIINNEEIIKKQEILK